MRGPSTGDTLTVPVGNYVSGTLRNYLSENPSDLRNFMSADTLRHSQGCQELSPCVIKLGVGSRADLRVCSGQPHPDATRDDGAGS
jgi:hypothetical protein